MAEAHGDRRVAAARCYVHLLRAHIDKENDVLFPLSEAVLDLQTLLLVAREFEKVEAEQGPAATFERAEAAVDRLAADLG
jgi:hemerythrin-like domain-containing protein